MSQGKKLHQAIEVADDFTADLEAGREHAAAFYAAGAKTLVSSFPAAEVAKWDGAEEKALVSDPDGLDLPDQAEHGKAA